MNSTTSNITSSKVVISHGKTYIIPDTAEMFTNYSNKWYCMYFQKMCEYASPNGNCSITACIKRDWSDSNDTQQR